MMRKLPDFQCPCSSDEYLWWYSKNECIGLQFPHQKQEVHGDVATKQ